MGKSTSLLHRRKVGDRSHRPNGDTSDDDFDDLVPSQTPQRWAKLIGVLIFVNLLLGYAHLQRRAGKKEPDVVKQLTDGNFSDHIASHPNGTLVNFFSSSCKHCAKLSPEFEEAAKQLQKTSDVSLVSVNAGAAYQITQQYKVTRFPTLLWFRRGRLVRDVAPSVRTTTKILEFVDESLQPAVIDFPSHDDFDEAVPQLRSVLTDRKSLPVVVGFGREPAVYEVLEQIGEKFRGLTAFLFVKDARENDPCIRAYFRNAESDKEFNVSASLKVENVQSWLEPLMVKKKPEVS